MEVAHSDTPIGHDAFGVFVNYFCKDLLGFGILERMEQRGGEVEVGAHFCGTGEPEVNFA